MTNLNTIKLFLIPTADVFPTADYICISYVYQVIFQYVKPIYKTLHQSY